MKKILMALMLSALVAAPAPGAARAACACSSPSASSRASARTASTSTTSSTTTAPYADRVELIRVATVESPLIDRASAPKQGDEGAPEATLVFEEGFVPALDGLAAGDDVLVLTWLDRPSRDVLRVYPRDDVSRGEHGVFATRPPHPP